MTTLKDTLSHLTYTKACKLLGANGARLIRDGGGYDIDLTEQVTLTTDLFQLNLDRAVVTIQLDPSRPDRLLYACNRCETACEHLGAAFSIILEEKLALGLAAPPPEKTPIEGLSDEELVRQAVEERAERARTEKMQVKSFDPNRFWTDYAVTNRASGRTYRVALRGWERGESFCTCPDFRKNTLGTCKHILHVIDKMKPRFNQSVRETPFKVEDISVYLRYGEDLELRLLIPEDLDKETRSPCSGP